MSNPQLPRSFQMPARRGVGLCIGFITGVLVSGSAMGAGQISTLNLSERRATPFSYEVDGVEYLWGQGNNQYLESFSLDGQIYDFGLSADRVEIRRDDIEGVASGEPCGVFVQSLDYSQATRTQAADFPADPNGSGNCDVEAMLASRIINRGAVDVFSNTAPDAKNIERIDYLFSYGASAPLLESGMGQVGHLASEKSGNNPVKMAAILALDEAGNPASYGPLVLIGASGCVDPAICYGITDLMHSYSMLQNNPNAPQSFPVETERSMESVGMAFVSLQALGLSPGQRYYGVSLFADDVDSTNHNLLDPTSFPDNTSDDYIVVGDDADIYGGLSGYFAGAALNEVAGSVFLDANGNGQPDDGEAGISNVSIILYSDENGNGLIDEGVDQPLGDPILSNMEGGFLLPGMPDGTYLLALDESDPDLPPGLQLPSGSNPQIISISGTDAEPAYFAFINSAGGSPDQADSDGDMIDDSVEGEDDTDNDGTPNYLDTDSDGDGIDDSVEGTSDTDGDGVPNYLDTDSDGDGISDGIEGTNDTDGDGVPDYLDPNTDDGGAGTGPDSDGDGIPDSIEGGAETDTDGDGTPDYLDTDSDGDGISDGIEGTDDTDGDGVPDYLDPNTDDGGAGTGPDSDGDGIPDSIEGGAETDTDGDGTPDYLDTDSDADGINDSVEGTVDTDADGASNYVDTDSDADGINDSVEGTADADADGAANYVDTDSDGDGIDDSIEGNIDTDGDGVPDYLDTDSDADGVSDSDEGLTDADADGVPDYIDPDSDPGAGPGPGDDGPLADPNTEAVNDSFTVVQGSTGNQLDVLANDADGVGTGLTLVEVSDPPNGTATIVDDPVLGPVIVYQPDANFYGTDSFTYVVQDADGTQVTGNVSVVVDSDLNNDGIGDTEQCDCTELKLETGIHGSGIGFMSLFGLMAMGLLLFLRLVVRDQREY